MIKRIIFLLFFFTLSTKLYANISNQQQLNIFFDQLKEIKNIYDGDVLEKKIWEIWNKHPTDNLLTEKLEFATMLMYEGEYNFSLQVFTNVINSDPKWSEAWNKRATLLYFMNDFGNSLDDIDKVLKLEPRHFGALSGRAQIYIKQKEYKKAVKDLKRVKKIYPLSRGSKLIPELEKLIKGLDI